MKNRVLIVVRVIVDILAIFALLGSYIYAYSAGEVAAEKRTQQKIVLKAYNAIDWARVQNENPQLLKEVDSITDKAKAEINATTGDGGSEQKAKIDAIKQKFKGDIDRARMKWLLEEEAK